MKADVILMGHGGGGMMTRKLIDEIIVSELRNPILDTLDDGACVDVPERNVVLTTDSYVVDPIFFPGGDIGRLAVSGTVNDLAMQGAEPRYLTLGLIVEEGVCVEELARVIRSVRKTADEVGVCVVAGDTKVIEGRPGKSGLYLNTAGLGIRQDGVDVSVTNARPGDAVIVTGTIGDHGVTILNARESLGMQADLQSDVAPLWPMVKEVLAAAPQVRCMRDPTRGGVAATVCDIAQASGCGIRLQERELPVLDAVTGACNFLGLDPLNVANEGKAVIVCGPGELQKVMEVLAGHPLGSSAKVIGHVYEQPVGQVVLETRTGGERLVAIPTGEDLPRIC